MAKILEMQNITKRFPGVLANDHVSLEVERGEVHILLGENGAGKTTLMNVLYGLYAPDEGEIYYEGKKVRFTSARESIRAGIGMIHQHFMLIPNHTVTENIILGMPSKRGILDLRGAGQKIRETGKRYGLDINPEAKVEDLTVGEQQRVEIVKALYRGASLLIMDEPTAVLTPQEVNELFVTLRQLIDQGLSIILITHKLSEVMAIADRITVLRDGKVIDTVDARVTTEVELARLMVGRDVLFQVEKTPCQPKQEVLQAANLVVTSKERGRLLDDLSLSIRAGEILGIAGVDGNGQSELAQVITGLLTPDSGDIRFNGEEITHLSVRERTERGISHIPEDRHKHGLVLEFSVAENLILQTYYRKPNVGRRFLRWKDIFDRAENLSREFSIKTPHVHESCRKLSGGNQQKVVLARELMREPMLLIAVHPTRGLDVGAIEYVHKKIIEERDRGAAVLLVSTELTEIMALSDRINVLYKGRCVGELEGKNTDVYEIGLLMAGQSVMKEEQA